MQKSLYILLFEPYLFNIYGNQRYIITLFKFLDCGRFKMVLLSPNDKNFGDNIADFGGNYVVFPAPRSLRRHGGIILRECVWGKLCIALGITWYSMKLVSFLIRNKIDIVQCHSIRALIMIGFAAKLAGKPIIWYIKGHLDNPVLDRLGFWLADCILFQNETNQRRKYPELIRKHEKKIELLQNGIDLSEIAEAEKQEHTGLKQELDIQPHRIHICFIGYLSPYKGIHYLLEAMVQVQREVSSTALYLVGGSLSEYPDYKTELETCVRDNKLQRITFTGWRQDVYAILSLMDIFVLPSLSEGVPKSIIEAMALGKPVIATKVGGVPELVKHGETGMILEPCNVSALADAIIRLAKDKSLREKLGSKARQIAHQEYSIEDNIRKLEALYVRIKEKQNR